MRTGYGAAVAQQEYIAVQKSDYTVFSVEMHLFLDLLRVFSRDSSPNTINIIDYMHPYQVSLHNTQTYP
jgi:hypothetical protein